jgi:hypothetical protein
MLENVAERGRWSTSRTAMCVKRIEVEDGEMCNEVWKDGIKLLQGVATRVISVWGTAARTDSDVNYKTAAVKSRSGTFEHYWGYEADFHPKLS